MTTVATSNDERMKKTEIARQHIEEIRTRKFSIGQKSVNPLTQDLHNAVTSLSKELYTKDVHFLMELIQNAEDNEYAAGVQPTLELVLTTWDITGLGSSATLLVFNNEIGFSKENIESLCSIGKSTKKGRRCQGFIGGKGIGFKSVFLVSGKPHIYSNGYQIRFDEAPNCDRGIGYIVPEWVPTRPTISDLQVIYGSSKTLPATTIILPLKPEKLETVKKHLSELHPEVLLFLHNIKRLSVREHSFSSSEDSVSAISISSETNLISTQNQGTDSRIVHLSVQEGLDMREATCRYYIYRQIFPVKPENVVDSRKDLNKWAISLAFPFGERLRRGSSSVGIFAFLPTAMVTNFPFVVQADFILPSSREAIVLDNKWNLGILDHVPTSFVNALMTCLNSPQTAEFFPVIRVLEFLPVHEPPLKQFNGVRESIRLKLRSKSIVPCESFSTGEMVFCEPIDVVRILPEFRKILTHMRQVGVSLSSVASQGKYVLHNSADDIKYDPVWNFLRLSSINDSYHWTAKCIQTCNLVSRVPTKVYVELLCFLADRWKYFPVSAVCSISLLKYIAWDGQVFLCSVSQITQAPLKVHLVWEARHHSWLNKWNIDMGCPDDIFFFPDETVTAIVRNKKETVVKNWLVKVGLVITDIYAYCLKLANVLREKKDRKLVVSLAHLVYHSFLKKHLDSSNVSLVLQSMPVVDMSDNVCMCTSLVPASRSQWVKLFGSSIVKLEGENMSAVGYGYYPSNYVELGEAYTEAANFAGNSTPEGKLLDFLIKHDKVTDLPDILPQDRALDIASNQLTSHQALLLLEWIQNLRAKKYSPSKYEIPKRFIDSVRCGKWMKTYSGFSSPSCCYLYEGTESSTLIEIGKEFKVLSAIDEGYYNHQIKSFKEVLVFVGVQMGSENIYQLIVNHVKPVLSSAMSGRLGISLLSFIRYSNANNKLDVEFLKTLQQGKWLKSNLGFVNPRGAIYLTSDVEEAILLITDLRRIDKTYYGNELQGFVNELKLLGVVVHVNDVYNLIPQHFRFPEDLSMLNTDAVFLLLKCIRQLGPEAVSLKEKIVCSPWMRTSFGFKCPMETILPHRSWGQLVEVLPLPIIDEAYYGSTIRSYKAELEAIGVVVNLDQVCSMLVTKVKFLLSSDHLTGDIVISLLNCIKCLKEKMAPQLTFLISFLSGEKWLKTRDGYRSAPDMILFDSDWASVSQFVDLPLIDDAFYGNSIFSFKKELKMLGVIVDFTEGARLVARGLELPGEPVSVRAECAFSLLNCAISLRQSSKSSGQSLPSLLGNFVNKLKGSKWIKTHMGYRTPEETLIFNPEWNSCLDERDGPFIDQGFYGNLTSLHKKELVAIGVKEDTEDVCTLIFQILTSHTETSAVMRIYRFLHKYMQSLNSQSCFVSQLWIPDPEGNNGKWVSNWFCVLHDRDNLFGSFLHVLDRHYEEELLAFLSTTFGVDPFPTLFRYVDLWNNWVACNHCVSSAELHSFWGCISEDWNPVLEKTIKKGITMLPAVSVSGAVQLVERDELFIPNDLSLKKLFGHASDKPLFVWFPQYGTSSLSKLYAIYRSFGVQTISDAVQISSNSELEKMDRENSLIGKPLIKIVLAFVANPVIYMPVEERHRIAKSLLDISIFGTEKPLMLSCFLDLPSSKKRLQVEMRKLVLWDENSQKLLVHKPSWNGGSGTKSMEFITDFSRAIAEAVLPKASAFVEELCKTIKIGFAFGFKEDEVDSLLLSENLELFPVDASFLECAFPAAKNQHRSRDPPCTPEASIHKKQRRY
ncbi:hypothetical protein Vadar_031865 [Vaccinium darrowii]|uniref:Uncharacterized protein n=1 Tax=Vaccinium darrowii TaxID=229202 RepID=A0ACB7Y400_9ERIC|nr:hypothetical protein Vadar_031865 [Vaccinium darrowii]